MKILVSACLLGQKVRYDGGGLQQLSSDFDWLLNNHDIIPFCPEVAAGLPTPRLPAEIIKGTGQDVLDGSVKVLANDGADVTTEFLSGAQLALDKCQQADIRYAVLTESSPSCGSNTIYDGQFNGTKQTGSGVTTALLRAHDIEVFSQHQLGILRSTLSQIMESSS